MICSLHDICRVKIVVKKGGKVPVSIKVDDGEVEYRVWLSLEFRPMKLQVVRDVISSKRREGFRADKGEWGPMRSKAWESRQMW